MTETPQEYRYRVRSGTEEIEVVLPICRLCNNPIYPHEVHRSCRALVEEQDAMERERQRRQLSLKTFGEVLDPVEYQIRMYPDSSYLGRETYNKRIAREAEEKRQARYEELQQRDGDARRLELMERQIIGLRAKVARDKTLAKQEAEEQKQQ